MEFAKLYPRLFEDVRIRAFEEIEEWRYEGGFSSEQLRDDLDDDPGSVHYHLFNEDYFMIGHYRASEWRGIDALMVLGSIVQWELANFGELTSKPDGFVFTPEWVANMFAYIAGWEIIDLIIEEVTRVHDEQLLEDWLNDKFDDRAV